MKKPMTPKEINRNLRKFGRDMKAAFEANTVIAANIKAENLLKLKIAIVNGDLPTVAKFLKEFPGMVNEVDRFFSYALFNT
jgi:hypothetical protein